MKRTKKIERAEDKLAAFLAARQGVTKEEVKKTVPKNSVSTVHNEESLILEADSVLLYYQLKGQGFKRQECKSCGLIFAYKYTTFGRVSLCSLECRKEELDKIGIQWNPYKLPEERWKNNGKSHGPLPAIVPPQALAILDEKLGIPEEAPTSPPDSSVVVGT